MEGDFRIEQWLIQPQLNTIVSPENKTVQLEPKVMEVLAYLAEHAGEVLPKERILQAVWADTFVTEDVLMHAISEIRKAFGDDARDPKIVQTIPKRGYRLIAPVSALREAASRYEIMEKLGEGGMGEVFLARDTELQRKVALKFIRAADAEDEAARKRLLREARAAAALDHPFVGKIFDTGRMDGRTFIAMEYVEGQTLKQKLGKGPLPIKEALRVAGEIAEALEAAHDKGIVHRDLKPSNVILTPQGHVKVMDFGLARRLPQPDASHSLEDTLSALTREGTTAGTLPYMSPEQLRGEQVDHRSDVFSFGIVLYETLTGSHPFGKRLIFLQSEPGKGWGLWSLSHGDGKAEALVDTAAWEAWPDISPDGRWLAYASDESGREEVYVRPFPEPGARHQISTSGGSRPAWSRDGRRLYYRSLGESPNFMLEVDVETQPAFRAGVPRALFDASDYATGAATRCYDVAADGRFLMVKKDGQEPQPVSSMILVQNWFEELKRLCPTGR